MNTNNIAFKLCAKCFTYNHSRYIADTMNGFCIQQTDFPFLCVIVDDASTDNEQSVIKQYLTDHFNVDDTSIAYSTVTDYANIYFAQHSTNVNCYFAVILLNENHYGRKSKDPYLVQWKKNIQYIAHCEGDDYWTDPLKLQKQVNFLEEHPECSCCVHSYMDLFDNQHLLKPHPLKVFNHTDKEFLLFNTKDYCDSLLDYSNNSYFTKTLTSVARQKSLNLTKYNSYRNKIDMAYFFALSTVGYIGVLKEVMGVYRINDFSVTAKNNGNERDFLNKSIPNIISVAEAEKTNESKYFVYIYLRCYLMSVILYHKKTLLKNIKYLGFRYGSRLLLDILFILLQIPINKMNKQIHKIKN